jgi:hypothetical protein
MKTVQKKISVDERVRNRLKSEEGKYFPNKWSLNASRSSYTHI